MERRREYGNAKCLLSSREGLRLGSASCAPMRSFFCANCAGNNRGAGGVGRWARLDFLPPALGHAFLPRLRVSARTGLFLYVKRLTARRFVK